MNRHGFASVMVLALLGCAGRLILQYGGERARRQADIKRREVRIAARELALGALTLPAGERRVGAWSITHGIVDGRGRVDVSGPGGRYTLHARTSVEEKRWEPRHDPGHDPGGTIR